MFKLSESQKSLLTARFNENYPDFVSFDEPGSFGEKELDYKRKALAKWNSQMGVEKAGRLIAEGQGDEVLACLKRSASANFVNFHAWNKLFGQDPESNTAVLRACLDAAADRSGSAESIRAIEEAAESKGLKLMWDAL